MNILALFLEQRDRWILWAPVAIAIGVGSYFALHAEPDPWMAVAVLILVSLRIIQLYVNKRRFLIWIPALLIALGFGAAQFRTAMLDVTMLQKKTYPLMVTGQVVHIDALPKNEHRLVLDNITYKAKYDDLPQDPMPEKVRVKLKRGGGGIVPRTGDVIRIKAILLPISGPVMPGAFDFQRYAYFKGFGATGFAISDVEVVKEREEGFIFPALRRYLRDNIKENIESSDHAAITIALLDGEDRDISDETNEVVRKAGIAHLMAISGLQVALVTGFFFFLLRAGLAAIPYVALRYPIKKIAAFIAMFGAIFYMFLIGDSVSAERSVIMMCVVMIAVILDRDPFTLRLAAFAASVMLLLQPEILFGASFQLSFSAVVALIAFYEATRNWWTERYTERRWYHTLYTYFLASLATTFVATIAVAPYSLFHFLKASLFPGLVANLVAVPVSSFITIPFAIVASFLMPLDGEYYPLQVCEWSVELILKVARNVAEWPHGMFYLDHWPMWILIVVTLGGLWICLWQGRVRWFGVLPIVIACAFIPLTPRADILVNDNARIFAARDDGGRLWFSSKRREKFVRNSWEDMEGDTHESGFWDEEGSPVRCDELACIYKRNGKTVSFVKDYLALQEDCEVADIVVSKLYIKRKLCSKPEVLLHKWHLISEGSQAIYIYSDRDVRIRSVKESRGIRPWTRYEYTKE